MRASFRWVRAHLWGLAVGVIVTVATAEAYSAGYLDWLSLFLLDIQFKHDHRIAADDRVVMIDINDYAVERVHKWPWPRKYHAELIDALDELGAAAILMDLVFDAPEAGRIEHPKLDPDYGLDPSVEILGDTPDTVDLGTATWDDAVFARSLRKAGNVYLAMFARLVSPPFVPDKIRDMAYGVLADEPGISFAAFRERFERHLGASLDRVMSAAGRSAVRDDPKDFFDRLRIERLLEQSYDLGAGELAATLGMDKRTVDIHLAPAKREVARRLVGRFRRTHPEGDWPEMFAAILPHQRMDVFNADRKDVLWARRAVRSEGYVVDSAPKVPPSLVGRIRNASDLTLPFYKLAEPARVGLVSFEADAPDGVMRRVALLVNARGRLLKHLGLAVACNVLDVDDRTIRMEDGNVLVMEDRARKRQWRIPVDAEGRTLINWHIDPAHPKWQHSFEHVPVTRLMQIPILRQSIADDETRRVYHRAELVATSCGDAAGCDRSYRKLVRRRQALRLSERTPAESAELADVASKIQRIEEASIAAIRDWAEEIANGIESPGDRAGLDPQTLHILETAETHERIETDLTRSMNEKRKQINEVQEALRPLIEGKICLVGYTATAVADTVNTPVFDEVPGVMAHANVINSMLLNRFPRSAPRWVIVLLILLTGTAVTSVTTWRDPWVSLFTMVLVVVALGAAALWAFYASSYHIDIVGPWIAVFLSWAFVTLYRQLTEERQKRAFSKSLAQYTSPAIAARLADQLTRQTGELDLSPRARMVTCFFSDLQGFTSISERLGASRTRDVLNPYLEAMSDVLIKWNAMINKFMGDGIFAFFNPPIHPVEDHARAACEAALDSFAALKRLQEEIGRGALAHEVRALRMRVGVNTGEVFVGDYGSSNKLDYTCIGDTVNLSARLEPACKPFGVSAMVSESTLTAAGDGYVVRHLGGLKVMGKKEAIQVYELIGRKGEVDGGVIEYAEKFGEAVAHFQARRWDAVLSALADCRERRPDDRAVDLLETNVRVHEREAPPADWNQAIELTTK